MVRAGLAGGVYAGLMPSWGPVEKATRAELRALDVSVQTSAAAAAVVAVAKRLDATTGAASAAAAARELRLAMAALYCGPAAPAEIDPEVLEMFEAFR
jgi:hypothetical protein